MSIVRSVIDAGFPQRPAHSAVFANIDRKGTRLSTLAVRANMTPQAMGELVDELVARGYLRRKADPTDGRAKLVLLTAKGNRCMDAALLAIASIEERLRETLGARRLADVQRALVQIIESWDGT